MRRAKGYIWRKYAEPDDISERALCPVEADKRIAVKGNFMYTDDKEGQLRGTDAGK